jgi:hypothetical protein
MMMLTTFFGRKHRCWHIQQLEKRKKNQGSEKKIEIPWPKVYFK